VRSQRSTPEEVLDVRFERVDQLSAFSVDERADLALVGSEEDLRTRILDDPSLIEAGFEPLATERETSAGPVDVFGRDTEDRPVVVELKRRRVGPGAVRQLQGYVDAVGREETTADVRGILVAPSVTDRAAALLDEWAFGFVSLTPETDGDRDRVDATGQEERTERADGPVSGTDADAESEPGSGSAGAAENDPDG
jgi:hypothetical protein